MSQEEPLSRKDRKAQRDAERHKKGKKRKHAETVEEEVADAPAVEKAEDGEKDVATKNSKKRKSADIEAGGAVADPREGASTEAAKRPKKKRKKTKSEFTTTAQDGDDKDTEVKEKPTKSRFILFIGNLSFKTTDETLRTHFKKLEPFTLRHLTDPKTKKSKGCAFIEFENYDRMKTCLKLYHHTIFDPTKKDGNVTIEEGSGTKLGKDARKINVELTVGGGGKTEGRKEKIKAKNVRLEEQRKRRAELEKKDKAKKEGSKPKDKSSAVKEESRQAGAGADQNASHGIHPSRLAQLNK